MHEVHQTLRISRRIVLAFTVMLTLGTGVVALSAPAAAGQSAGPAVETGSTAIAETVFSLGENGAFQLTEDTKLWLGLVAEMILLALLEMAVIARPSFRWVRLPSFSLTLPSGSDRASDDHSDRGEERVFGIEESPEPTEPAEPDESHAEDAGQPPLTAIQQISDGRADILREAGYESVEAVATASQNTLTDVEGIGGARAATLIESANTLLDSQSDDTVGDAPAGDNEKRDVLTVQFDPDADDSPAEAAGPEETDVLTSPRAAVAAMVRRACGHTRMLFDRRALDPRAYGATNDWTALTFECSAESESVREVLEEIVYVGEVPVEITGQAPANRPARRLSFESSVRVPREGIEQVEHAAQDGKPEAKRTVTLLRRALQAEEDRAIRGSTG